MKITFKEILPDIISSRNATQKCLDDKDWSSTEHQYHKECRERAKNDVAAYNMLIEFIQLNEGKEI